MPEWNKDTIFRLTSSLVGITSRRRAVIEFAKEHKLIYFQSVSDGKVSSPVIRGSSTAQGQFDENLCIGSHAGYDLAMVERTANVAFAAYKTTIHRWYVLQIDLKSATNLPYIFIGTRQQTKAYYARILTTHRELRYLALDTAVSKRQEFHSHYAILASPAELPVLHRLFSDEIITMMATHNYPYAIEIEDDTLYVITEAMKPSQQLLDKLLHYGLWMAKEIDRRLV